MPKLRGSCGTTAARVAALALVVLPQVARAENAANFFNFTPAEYFAIGAVFALPTAIACVCAEAILPRRHLPHWLSATCAIAALASAVLAIGAMKGAGPARATVLLWFAVPALTTLALRGVVAEAPLRLASGWAIAAVAWASARGPDSSSALLLLGGAATCLLPWTAAVLILRQRGAFPPAAAASTFDRSKALVRRIVDWARTGLPWASLPAADSATPSPGQTVDRFRSARAGLIWWGGAGGLIYLGIGAAIAAGALDDGAWLAIEWQYVVDLFGLHSPRQTTGKQLWWMLGMPWSLLAASAVWGLAGLLGAFDPGRLRPARFAAVVFGGALVAWTASIIVQTAAIRSAEEQASGIQRR